MPRYREVLQQWVQPLRTKRTPQLPSVEELESAWDDKPHKTPKLKADKALEIVNRRKADIIKALDQRDLDSAHELVDKLVDYQKEHEKPEHLSMSLCDLAVEAKRRGLHSIQLDLTEMAVEANPADGWAWAQRGDALLTVNQFSQALTAYEEASNCGGSLQTRSVAQAGRAEVLKAMGKLPEALAAYEQVRREHPGDVFAQTGRADVLKAMGKLPEALDVYEQVRREHPGNAVAQAGRAEVLKAMGKLPEALAAYEQVRREHPGSAVAQNGRAEVLKAMGKLPEALAAYEQVRREHPEDIFARNGRSCVLTLLGRYEEALEDLPQAPSAAQNCTGYHIRGMVLLRSGAITEAIQIFRNGAEHCPIAESVAYFRTALVVAITAQRRYQEALDELNHVALPTLSFQSNVLRLHLFGALGEKERAEAAYAAVKKESPFVAPALVEELHWRFILGRPARRTESWVSHQEVDNLLLAA